jgi:hypothetical protein
MTMLAKSARAALTCAMGLALTLPVACGTPTKVTSEWKDASRIEKPVDKIMVMGLRLQPSQRRVVEDTLVAKLKEKGTAAEPSYRVLGDMLPDRDTARDVLDRKGFHGVLVVRMRSVDERPVWVPQNTSSAVWYNTYWGAPYATGGAGPYGGGYVVMDKTVTFDSDLCDLRDGRRIWSVTTETTNPSSGNDFAKSLSKELVPRLEKENMVGSM